MKAPSSGFGRPLRWLGVLVCVGGAALAADKTWTHVLPLDQFPLTEWFSSFVEPESPAADMAVSMAPGKFAQTNFFSNRWLNSYLFSRPTAAGWTLASSATGRDSVSTSQALSAPPLVDSSSSTMWPASFPGPGFGGAYSAAAIGPIPAAPTANGSWSSTVSGNWSNPANWSSNVIADGAANSAHFDALNISNDVTVNLDTSRTIGNLFIGDTNGTNHYTIAPVSGSTLTFDPNSTSFLDPSTLQQTSTSAGDTIAANIFFKNDLLINNLSASHQFTISGNIASSAANGSSHALGFNSSGAAGDILVSGNISNGNTGATIFLGVENGTVTLTGTNTYTGGTDVFGGTLLINGDNSAASGGFYVENSGTLGGHGIIGSDVNVFGGNITGDTTTTVGTLTMNSLTFGGEVGGGTYIANLSGATSDLLAITQTLTIFNGTGLQIVGAADNIHTYVLATFGSRSGFHGGEFDPTLVTGIPAGYTLVYNTHDIQLIPTAIPEPATWIGGALALGAAAFAQRRRLRRYWLSVIGG